MPQTSVAYQIADVGRFVPDAQREAGTKTTGQDSAALPASPSGQQGRLVEPQQSGKGRTTPLSNRPVLFFHTCALASVQEPDQFRSQGRVLSNSSPRETSRARARCPAEHGFTVLSRLVPCLL